MGENSLGLFMGFRFEYDGVSRKIRATWKAADGTIKEHTLKAFFEGATYVVEAWFDSALGKIRFKTGTYSYETTDVHSSRPLNYDPRILVWNAAFTNNVEMDLFYYVGQED